ncbi:hypothetical protein [Leptolyngbya sp. 7M]|uniref:hypothetical protein n=1 Tax=Leptolyngbya sp. 7M TaxID=2812896 RepID=UPI001B8AAEA1|nr:hypothetical protein [Leptolyngbya sp. 7M]QYO65734.1 hypothetical protein JVX88_02780 [Leptolyngbya sp. 7M]
MSIALNHNIYSDTGQNSISSSEKVTAFSEAFISGKGWEANASIVNCTSAGASVECDIDCRVGCLLKLKANIPANLRAFDEDGDDYEVWCVVQSSQIVSDHGSKKYHVSLAFSSKEPPESYLEDPDRSYRITGVNELGLWKIAQSEKSFTPRRSLRYWTSVEHYLAVLDGKRDPVRGERTKTDNISSGGAAVFTTLSIGIGDRVKFISAQYDFSGLAIVCGKTELKNGRSRLNLKFIEEQFPIEKLKQKKKKR